MDCFSFPPFLIRFHYLQSFNRLNFPPFLIRLHSLQSLNTLSLPPFLSHLNSLQSLNRLSSHPFLIRPHIFNHWTVSVFLRSWFASILFNPGILSVFPHSYFISIPFNPWIVSVFHHFWFPCILFSPWTLDYVIVFALFLSLHMRHVLCFWILKNLCMLVHNLIWAKFSTHILIKKITDIRCIMTVSKLVSQILTCKVNLHWAFPYSIETESHCKNRALLLRLARTQPINWSG